MIDSGFPRRVGVVEQRFEIAAGTATLAGERAGTGEPVVVLLHAGVGDRRSWAAVQRRLAADRAIVSYDRRGYGETTTSGPEDFTHAGDLARVLDAQAGDAPAILVGS